MSINSPCWDFVTWWKCGGFCPPALNGPWLLIGVLRVTTSRSLAGRMAFWRLRRPWEQN